LAPVAQKLLVHVVHEHEEQPGQERDQGHCGQGEDLGPGVQGHVAEAAQGQAQKLADHR